MTPDEALGEVCRHFCGTTGHDDACITLRIIREVLAREIEADPFWTGARHAQEHAAAILRGAATTEETTA